MKTIAMILTGCGNRDGSEIHETVLSMVALKRLGIQIKCFAPNTDQAQTLNYLTGDRMREKRNCLVESARIARGEIEPVSAIRLSDFDGIVMPGGFGAAINLTDYPEKGATARPRPEIEKLLRDAHAQKKAIGAICIAPVVVAAALREVASIQLTIGNDAETSDTLTQMGHRHVVTPADGVCVDTENRIVTTPAYMLAKDIVELEKGINAFAKKFVEIL